MVRQVLTVYRPDGSFRLVSREPRSERVIVRLGPCGCIELPPDIRQILGIEGGGEVRFTVRDKETLVVGVVSDQRRIDGNEREENREAEESH